MGGTTDWAVDLAKWYDGPDGSLGEDFDLSDLPDLACVSTSWPTTPEDLSNKVDSIAPACRNQVIISILLREFNDAIARYREVSEGCADKVRQRTAGDGRMLLTELGIVRRIMLNRSRRALTAGWTTLRRAMAANIWTANGIQGTPMDKLPAQRSISKWARSRG
jgi:hypothetical protein